MYSCTHINLGIRWRCVVQLNAPAALPSGDKAGAGRIGDPEPIWTLTLLNKFKMSRSITIQCASHSHTRTALGSENMCQVFRFSPC
jgi:hypothetical protein